MITSFRTIHKDIRRISRPLEGNRAFRFVDPKIIQLPFHVVHGSQKFDDFLKVFLGFVDTGDIVVHVFQKDARDFYDLDSLWADAPRVALEAPKAS